MKRYYNLWRFLTIVILICYTSSLSSRSRPGVDKSTEGKFLNEKDILDIATNEETPRQILSDAAFPKETLMTLSDALRVHPFKIWKLKHRFSSVQALGIDESKLGSFIDYPRNQRLVQKLYKVLKGEDVYLTVMGGSNSGGAGVQEDEGGAQGVYPRVITDWWANTITPLTGSQLNMNLVSIGGTASNFYQYCYRAYLKNNLDLVLLESSVNDLHVKYPENVNKSLALEQLTRQLLLYPTQPALIYVNLYRGSNQFQGCKNLEDYGQQALSDAYKITSIRWRDLVCPITVGNIRRPLSGLVVYCRDGDHVNLLGHGQVSLMVINTIRQIILEIISNGQAPFAPLEKSLPNPVYIKTPNKIISNPLCWTTVTANYQKTSVNNDLTLRLVKNIAFQYWPLIRLGYSCEPPRVCRTDAFSGYVGRTAGAKLIVSFTVPPGEGMKRRSVVFATRTCSYCGKAKVWIDNDFENGKIVEARQAEAQTSVNIIALRVSPGVHTLTISVLEPANVTFAGLMLGPPDGPY